VVQYTILKVLSDREIEFISNLVSDYQHGLIFCLVCKTHRF
jgi:hypothetical protein